MKKIAVGFLLWLASGTLAFTQTYEDVEALFDAGDFEQTAEAGRALETSDGYALAVRAQLVLIQYIYQPDVRLAAVDRAIKDGEKAILLDPSNLEAKLNLGVIIGLRGKFMNSISDGKRSRELFEEGLEMAPENSWALGILASWHGETIYQTGKILARMIFGARRKISLELFAKTMEVEPDNLTIRAAYIRTLIKLNRKTFRALIAENIAYMEKAEPKNALERLMKKQIRQIKAAMETGNNSRLDILLDEAVPLTDTDLDQ